MIPTQLQSLSNTPSVTYSCALYITRQKLMSIDRLIAFFCLLFAFTHICFPAPNMQLNLDSSIRPILWATTIIIRCCSPQRLICGFRLKINFDFSFPSFVPTTTPFWVSCVVTRRWQNFNILISELSIYWIVVCNCIHSVPLGIRSSSNQIPFHFVRRRNLFAREIRLCSRFLHY